MPKAKKPAEVPVFTIDGTRARRRLYARAAVPLSGGAGIFIFMILYHLMWDHTITPLILSLLGVFLAAQGVLLWVGTARNPDFAIYRKRIVMPRGSPVQAFRAKDFSIPLRHVRRIEAGAEDRFVFETKAGNFPLDLREHSSDPEEIADMRLHLNRLVDRLEGNGNGNFKGNVLRKGRGL